MTGEPYYIRSGFGLVSFVGKLFLSFANMLRVSVSFKARF